MRRRLSPIALATLLLAALVAGAGLTQSSASPARGAATVDAPPPAPHPAASRESTAQDEGLVTFSGVPEVQAAAIAQLARLGADRLRVNVIWKSLAPARESLDRPAFDAADPGAYPPGTWDSLDRIVVFARQNGMDVNFDLTGPAPRWATPTAPDVAVQPAFRPSAREYARFVTAVGRRYSGRYRGPGLAGADPVVGGCGPPPTCVTPPGGLVPRVSYWSIWNEPNYGVWLAPQADPTGRVEIGPRLYRELADVAWSALHSTGHGRDTILVGDLAPKGKDVPGLLAGLKALRFLRALYCVDRSLRPLRGAAASASGCPTGGGFAAAHPVLFAASGWAQHPYSQQAPPGQRSRDPDWATIADLPRIERTLDGAFAAWGSRRRVPLFLTEYGYQTNPPDPRQPTSPAEQSRYLNQAEFLAWRDRRVRTLSQYLLRDEGPRADLKPSSPSYWSTFQSGLELTSGRPKPALAAYRLPLFLPRPVTPGRRVTVWGLVRTAPNGSRPVALLQFRPVGAARFRTLRRVVAHAVDGSFLARIAPPGPGDLRLAWQPPRGPLLVGRAVRLHTG